MRVTTAELRGKGACESQVLLFKKEWGAGCEVTLPNLLRAVELNLNISWFACNCLPTPIKQHFKAEEATIWKRYYAELATLIDKLINRKEEDRWTN